MRSARVDSPVLTNAFSNKSEKVVDIKVSTYMALLLKHLKILEYVYSCFDEKLARTLEKSGSKEQISFVMLTLSEIFVF